ncbi:MULTISPECIES: hypothetical protein [Streptomyces]|uniref:hypothetical protein n=2 Tax=Streptomyces TaxID=1883 RepID=UPI001371CBB5|nr:hypothetical protein [Streptomyces sp. SID6139]MYR17558.1 hypothetical protein [Streptomyces sp. SID6137]
MDPITATAFAAAALVAKGALESAGGEAGRSSWTGFTRLTERLRARFGGDDEATAALDQVHRHPADETAVTTLQRFIHSYALHDSRFEADLGALVEEARAASGGRGHVNATVIKNATTFNEQVTFQGGLNIN